MRGVRFWNRICNDVYVLIVHVPLSRCWESNSWCVLFKEISWLLTCTDLNLFDVAQKGIAFDPVWNGKTECHVLLSLKHWVYIFEVHFIDTFVILFCNFLPNSTIAKYECLTFSSFACQIGLFLRVGRMDVTCMSSCKSASHVNHPLFFFLTLQHG